MPSATRPRSASPPKRSKSTARKPRRTTRTSASDLKLSPAPLRRARERLRRFVKFFGLIPTPDGERQRLEPFQRLILLLYFAGIRHVLVLIPKGNGKTSLLAALAIFHMLTHPNPRIYIGASTVDQADTIYNECVRIVKGRKAWRERLKPSPGYRAIYAMGATGKGEPERGLLKILASDKLGKGSLEGLQPTLGIVEELHAHVNDSLYAAIHGGLGKRDGQMVSISTAGADEDSLLGIIRARAKDMAHQVRRGTLRIVRSPADEFAMLEWSIGDASHKDFDAVKAANPASFVTKAWLRETYEDPGMTPTRWKRYHCGLWAAVEGRWIDGHDWSAAAFEGNFAPEPGERLILGYDHARTFDHAALIGLRPTGERRGIVFPVAIWHPEDFDAEGIPYWLVEKRILEIAEEFSIIACGFDPGCGFKRSAEVLADAGVPMVQVSMSSPVWAPLSAELRAAIIERRLRHSGDPELTTHVLAGETKDSTHGERLHGRTPGKAKVDALIAMGIAWHTAFSTDALATLDPSEWYARNRVELL